GRFAHVRTDTALGCDDLGLQIHGRADLHGDESTRYHETEGRKVPGQVTSRPVIIYTVVPRVLRPRNEPRILPGCGALRATTQVRSGGGQVLPTRIRRGGAPGSVIRSIPDRPAGRARFQAHVAG